MADLSPPDSFSKLSSDAGAAFVLESKGPKWLFFFFPFSNSLNELLINSGLKQASGGMPDSTWRRPSLGRRFLLCHLPFEGWAGEWDFCAWQSWRRWLSTHITSCLRCWSSVKNRAAVTSASGNSPPMSWVTVFVFFF